MSTERPGAVTVRDLAEEAKKRIVFLIVCVVGLSYLMSLTSSSVMVNVPAAVVLIVLFRYLSMDFEMRAKAATYKRKSNPTTTCTSQLKSGTEHVNVKIERPDWRRKVNSHVVENAIDHFTRHIVSEWVTELWYSKVTPDKQGPEELAQIINGVAGEISSRVRNINIIDLLTRDIINILCSELELFRASQAKIEKLKIRSLSFEERDERLRSILFVENKLHPCLFSAEAEHKVLQHLMDGIISLTFTKEDLQCSLFRYIVRELLACVVIRPVLNLASPRFINEKIESLVISLRKPANKTISTETAIALAKPNGSLNESPDPFANFVDPSSKGFELVQLKKDQSGSGGENEIENGDLVSKDPLLSMDARATRSWDSLPLAKQVNVGGGIQRHRSGGEWGDMLDDFSERKTKALAPEHFDNMWTKGRDYKRKDAEYLPVHSGTMVGSSKSVDQVKKVLHQKENEQRKAVILSKQSVDNKEDVHDVTDSDEFESGSSISTEDEGTGLDSPSVRVWDGNNKRNITRIHHPLENFDGHKSKKAHKGRKLSKTKTNLPTRKRSQDHVWQEVERTSFLLGEGLDVLNPSLGKVKDDNFSDESGGELCSQISNGSMTSSYLSSKSFTEANNFLVNPVNAVVNDPFFTLRCEVAGANIVKSDSRTFAVYSVSVTDMNNHSWSIKRRYRHFEELHRRLKEFPEYNLHLPPKQFLSTGLDVMVIQQRCKLLNKYLQELMQIHTISGSIEVWDFLSVDSQTYLFSSSFSIIETLSVKSDNNKSGERSKENLNFLSTRKENLNAGSKINHDPGPIRSREISTTLAQNSPKKSTNSVEDSSSESDNARRSILKPNKNVVSNSNPVRDGVHASSNVHLGASSDPAIPSEWIPPNLCQPILDVVDVVFQLQDGGWIRRKVFWVAKQVLQLGMGDAFDDWLLEKIGLLRRGPVVASGINRIEQILWPDGIFITKHPSRKKPSSPPSSFSPKGQDQSPMSSPKTDDAQQKEAERRARLVHELMIDKAPGAVVGIVGRKEYDQCANDLYYFIQSSVFMKQLAMDILELLILSAFPELEYVFRQVHEEKEKFGNFQGNNIKA